MENEKSTKAEENLTIFDIVVFPDERLRMTCDEVKAEEFGTDSLKAMERGLITSMQYYGGVGMAAPQVSINRRMFCFRVTDGRVITAYNPTVMPIGDMAIKMVEGCLSIPKVEEMIERFDKVSLSYKDRNGVEHREIFQGLDAVVVQHENDHLNGVLFIDYLSKLKRDRLIQKLRKGDKKKDSLIQLV